MCGRCYGGYPNEARIASAEFCGVKDELRRIKIGHIPKAGKDLSAVENYRPIELFNVPLKILEAQLKDNIQRYLDGRKFLPERSCAFRRGHSTSKCEIT